MKPHQERVVTEKQELDIKLDRLVEFMKGSTFAGLDDDEWIRLARQLDVMLRYSNVLGERIAAFA